MRFGLTVFGNKTTSVALIEHLIAQGITVDLVVTLKPEATTAEISGRADVGAFCADRGIHYYGAESYSLRKPEDAAFFASNEFDLGLCTGWQRLIPASVLDCFGAGVFGWHGSLFQFPNGRGRSPLNWSIRLGGERVYHNAFRYTAGADDGPIFDTRVVEMAGDYIADLQAKALDHIKDSAVQIVEAHSDGSLNFSLTEQPPGASVHFPKLAEADGAIHLDRMTAKQIVDLVRSCSRPFPGAFLPGVRVWRCDERPASDALPGEQTGPQRYRATDADIVVTEGGPLDRLAP